MGDISQRDLRSVWLCDEHGRECFNIFAEIPSVPHTNWKTLPAFNRKRHILAADRGFDHVLGIADIDAVSSRGCSIDVNFKIRRAGDPFRVEIHGSRHVAQYALDLDGFLLDGLQVGAKHFHAYLSPDS